MSVFTSMLMTFIRTFPSSLSVSTVCLSWSTALMTSPTGSLKMVFSWTHLRLKRWHSDRCQDSKKTPISIDTGTDCPTNSIGECSLPVAAAHTWSSLPPSLTALQSLQTFRKRLKTELFQRSYTTSSFLLLNFFCNVTLKFSFTFTSW